MIGIKRGHMVWLKRDPDGGGGIWTERKSAGVGEILDGEVTIPNKVKRALEEATVVGQNKTAACQDEN